MHSGKKYEAGKQDAFKECFDLLSKLMNEKEGFISKVGSDGVVHEYMPVDTIRAYAYVLLGMSEPDKSSREKK